MKRRSPIWIIIWTLLIGIFALEPITAHSRPHPTQPAYGCVATSLYYFFQLSPDFHFALERLPGNTHEQKLSALNRIAKQIQGDEFFMGLHVLEKEQFIKQVLEQINIDTARFQFYSLQRNASEVHEGLFSKRVSEVLSQSLNNGLPLIAGLRFALEEGGSLGHTVLITGVSKLPSFHNAGDGDSGFEIEFLNPAYGRTQKAIVYEEVEKSFEAFIYSLDPIQPVWSKNHLFVLKDNKMVSSPYLKIKGSTKTSVPSIFELSDEVHGQAHLEEVLLLESTLP